MGVPRACSELQRSGKGCAGVRASCLHACVCMFPDDITCKLPVNAAAQFEPMVEQTIVHYATDGWLLHKGSEEAKRQMDTEKMEQEVSACSAQRAQGAMPQQGQQQELQRSSSAHMRGWPVQAYRPGSSCWACEHA